MIGNERAVTVENCIGCGTRDELSIEVVKVVSRPLDGYIAIVAGYFIGGVAESSARILSRFESDFPFRMIAAAAMIVGFVYYFLRSSSVGYALLFCEGCRKKVVNREFNRIVVKTVLVLLAIGGAVTVSAVMKRDDYVELPVIVAAMLGVVAWYFKIFARPKFVSIGKETSVISIPDIGQVQLPNPN